MKYSDSVKAMLFAAINELAAVPEKYALNPGKDFSQERKLGFCTLLHMPLTYRDICHGIFSFDLK